MNRDQRYQRAVQVSGKDNWRCCAWCGCGGGHLKHCPCARAGQDGHVAVGLSAAGFAGNDFLDREQAGPRSAVAVLHECHRHESVDDSTEQGAGVFHDFTRHLAGEYQRRNQTEGILK